MAGELESDSVALERVYGDLPHEAEVRTVPVSLLAIRTLNLT